MSSAINNNAKKYTTGYFFVIFGFVSAILLCVMGALFFVGTKFMEPKNNTQDVKIVTTEGDMLVLKVMRPSGSKQVYQHVVVNGVLYNKDPSN